MAKKQPANNPIEVDSLPAAASIIAAGIPLSTHRREGTRLVFVFDDQRAAQLVADYGTGRLMVSASRLFRAFDSLRDLVRGRTSGRTGC